MVAAIEEQVAAAGHLPSSAPRLLSLAAGLENRRSPVGFAHDHARCRIGQGVAAFAAARLAFERWTMFDLGWVRIANSQASIVVGQTVAVEAHTFGLWSLNLCRILETVNSPVRFGFQYGTTARHVEQGEERFLLEYDPMTGDVWYELEAVSQPRQWLARLGFPLTRSLQHTFALDSLRRMREAVLASSE